MTEDSVAAIALFISRKTEINVSVFITCRAIAWRRRTVAPKRGDGGVRQSKLKYRLYDYRRAHGQTIDTVHDADVSGLRAE